MENVMDEEVKHILLLGLSSSLLGGMAYGFIISIDVNYFTPALGIAAGLLGGLGIALKDIFSEKDILNDELPLGDLVIYIIFGIIALLIGYVLVYLFIDLPNPAFHGEFVRPSEHGTIFEFFRQTLGIPDVFGAILGAITSSAIPQIFKKSFKNLMNKNKTNQFY